jgi:hypothetical protein
LGILNVLDLDLMFNVKDKSDDLMNRAGNRQLEQDRFENFIQ